MEVFVEYMRFLGVFKNISHKLTGKTVLDAADAEELEEALIEADVAFETAEKIIKRVGESKAHSEGVRVALEETLVELLSNSGDLSINLSPEKPTVLLVAGVNGVGKTTTIGKLARLYKKAGKSVLLSAADTFRAAAIDQLEIWAERVGAEFIKHKPGADTAAVVFDSVMAARSRGTDIVIVDTAGRLHTKTNLMEELKKISRSVAKANGRPPDETLLVLDATTGQNAVAQAREFQSAIAVTGLVLAKMDSSARGGTVISIKDELGVPVKLIGTGEQMDNLQEFHPREFVRSLFD